jgi:hypothetical protein
LAAAVAVQGLTPLQVLQAAAGVQVLRQMLDGILLLERPTQWLCLPLLQLVQSEALFS